MAGEARASHQTPRGQARLGTVGRATLLRDSTESIGVKDLKDARLVIPTTSSSLFSLLTR